ncbi:Cytosolic carboxypeptidase [Dirofilaria immitis]
MLLKGPDSTQEQVRVPNVIALAGLPARGKTYISHKLCRYLNWIGIKTKAFNVGDYRRKVCSTEDCESQFFSPYNKTGSKMRDEYARLAMEDLERYLTSKEGEVAIFDATNTTRERRSWLANFCHREDRDPPFRLFFVESICDDPDIINANITEVKVNSPDYKGHMTEDEAKDDFLKRIENYKLQYQPIDDELDNDLSFIKVINAGRSFFVHNVNGHVQKTYNISIVPFGNDDENRIGKMDSKNHLLFESRFEGGNLRRAIQVNKWYYQLILSPDINELRPHFQWFFFEVSNNETGVDYVFEIINCFKKTSMFNRGMQPVLFSVTDACRGNPKWVRVGSAVCYCRNTFIRNDSKKMNDASTPRYYFSLYFTIRFKYHADVCYIAYHFPYTYSMLQATLERYLSKNGKEGQIYVRNDQLCTSLAGNTVSLITVTANGTKEQLFDREIILLSARVHPGENNTSWIMHGIMDFLMSDTEEAMELRDRFVFKLIPMLNVDGVVNGSHRCSLAGVDLNRTWDKPSRLLHPAIYHSKAIIQYIIDVLEKKPFLFIDIHGHSKNFNLFLYGNNPDNSWRALDHSLPGKNHFMSLPLLLQQTCDYFSLSNCRFNITKTKESSGRITLWRQFGITRSYTLESTYCGFNCGSLKGYQVNIEHLMDMGKQLCKTFSYLKNDNPSDQQEDDDDDDSDLLEMALCKGL